MQTPQERIAEIESAMLRPDFWSNPQKAQGMYKELETLKATVSGKGKYDRSNAIVTIVAGAGGDDAEDFARMLVEMYGRYAEGRGWSVTILDANPNERNGYRNIVFEIGGKMPTAFFVPNLESTVWCACHRLMPMENDKPLLRLSKCHRRLMTLKKLISKKMNLRPRTQSQVGQEDKTSTSEKLRSV
jgi:hypothetical protein